MENQSQKGFIPPPPPPIEKLEIFPLETKKKQTLQRKDIASVKKGYNGNENENNLPKIKYSKKDSPSDKNKGSGEKTMGKYVALF